MNEQIYAQFIELLQKSINDELSAVVLYKRIAETLTGPGAPAIAAELREHADEEYEHFKLLLEFSAHYGILKSFVVSLEEEANFDITVDTKTAVDKIQSLELDAISTYKKLLTICKENMIIEGCKLFTKLVTDEQEHYDDLAFYNGITRQLPVVTTEKVKKSVADLIMNQ